ncbi:hypothetical protein LCGC14_0815580 [marine sediment metagenome]|uniref:Uncharacterized protein n=1 Tax=marine sediment metagenome TaxID=412755 RepID=A0A0F9ST06_9ZZZZ
MKKFFSDLGFFNYILLLMALSVCIISVGIYNNITTTIEEIQEQYIKDLDKAVEAKREELRLKGLLLTDLQ